ncbi:MAG TPA: WbqC family protein [Opitutaceae bacterium]|nr:WbqC family protein [Opitutaceae bacterium]
MRVCINQSNYIPWRGYFDLIHEVDLFVLYDDVQFTKNDWRNRNLIKHGEKTRWLTIPVGQDIRRLICEVTIREPRWQKQHWESLRHAYGKAPFFEWLRPFLEQIYLGGTWNSLSELNHRLIEGIGREFLGITTRFADSRDFTLSGTGQERVLSLLKMVGATSYLSGPAGQAYLQPAEFARQGIDLAWMDYTGYPTYPQSGEKFEPSVSVLDLLFNTGPAAPDYIWGWRRGQAGQARTK